MTDQSPILVIGGPRMGTTWVATALSFAQGAALINEPDNDGPDPFALKAKLPLGRFPVLDESDPDPPLYRELWERAFAGYRRAGPLAWVASRLEKGEKTGRELLEALCGHPRRRAALWVRVLAHLARPPSDKVRGRPLVLKSVHAPLALAWVVSRMEPRVVVVLRHPLNTIASWLELGWGGCSLDTQPKVWERFAGPWGFPQLPESRSMVAAVTWQVALFIAALHAALDGHPERLSVSHESLCVDPVGGFQGVFTDLGLTWTDQAERFVNESDRPGSGYDTSRVAADLPDGWKRRLSREQLDEIRRLVDRIGPAPWIDDLARDLG